ncbi:unnamed protein product [Meganyctiphanes norvegica]|uniref:Transposase Tc1-like domain-containing protein n=1 Tax=Meganyctiphanes norvegica TaxID=48144 RepID=A0AAV2R092_MEGNR
MNIYPTLQVYYCELSSNGQISSVITDLMTLNPLYKNHLGPAFIIGPHRLSDLRGKVDKSRTTIAKQFKERHPQLLINVSERTVRRILHRELLFKWRCAWKKPLVTRPMTNRVKFAKGRNGWSISNCKTVLWSDEAIFTVTSNRPGKVRRRPGSDPLDISIHVRQ